MAVRGAEALRRLDRGALPVVMAKRLVIVGATGMVGGYALRYALDHPDVGAVTAIGRRKIGITHPKLDEVQHPDCADCSALAAPITGQHAAVFSLGTTPAEVTEAELATITVDDAVTC